MKSMIVSVLMLLLAVTTVIGSDGEQTASVLIDVRTEAEWNTGHISGAVLIPHDRIIQDIIKTAPDRKTKIYLYCRSGRRSGLAFDELKKAGYEDIINLGTVEQAAGRLNRQIVK